MKYIIQAQETASRGKLPPEPDLVWSGKGWVVDLKKALVFSSKENADRYIWTHSDYLFWGRKSLQIYIAAAPKGLQ